MSRAAKGLVPERPDEPGDLSRSGFHHIGNSTHWLVLEGVYILTDPWLSEPADKILVHRTLPVRLPSWPDVVLLTHKHGDHFDPAALDRLERSATVLVEEGRLAEKVARLGFPDVRGVEAGQHLSDVRGLTVDVVKGKHSCTEVCYRVERNGRAFFFGGDTMLTPEIEALARDKPVPFAILPGERSSLLGLRYVMTPDEAVGLAQRLGASRVVLSHHEYRIEASFPWNWIVRVPPVEKAEFPSWFIVPEPGDFVAFPWDVPVVPTDDRSFAGAPPQ